MIDLCFESWWFLRGILFWNFFHWMYLNFTAMKRDQKAFRYFFDVKIFWVCCLLKNQLWFANIRIRFCSVVKCSHLRSYLVSADLKKQKRIMRELSWFPDRKFCENFHILLKKKVKFLLNFLLNISSFFLFLLHITHLSLLKTSVVKI